jgi:hypothetical protein
MPTRPLQRRAAAVETTNEQSTISEAEAAELVEAGLLAAGADAAPPSVAAGNADVPRPPAIPVAETLCMQGGIYNMFLWL